MKDKPLVYLASPYTHKDALVRDMRAAAVTIMAHKMMQEGIIVFSPVSYGHTIAKLGDMPTDWQYWEKTCRAYLSHSHKIVVLMLQGWEESTGVTEELKIAKELGIDVEFVNL